MKNLFRQFSGSFEPDLLDLSFILCTRTHHGPLGGRFGFPPLGTLNRDAAKLPRIKVTLGGDEFPFQVYGYSKRRPDRELDGVILDPEYREAGWCVIWGPSFESESEGLVRKFKLSPVTPEGHPEPEYHEG